MLILFAVIVIVFVIGCIPSIINWLTSCHHVWNMIEMTESVSTDQDLRLNGGSTRYSRITRTLRCYKCGEIRTKSERIKL